MAIGATIPFSKARRVILRDDFCCRYCGKKLKLEQITFDHVIPIARYGRANVENLVVCCKVCNNIKGKELILPKTKPHRNHRQVEELINSS